MKRSTALPIPVKAVVWLPSLSLIVRVARRVPVPAGVKVTVTEQLAPAEMIPTHVVLPEKSLPLVPVIATLEMESEVERTLVIVITSVAPTPIASLAKAEFTGEKLTGIPVPLRLTVWGPPSELSVTMSDAERAPSMAG